jgi:YggT family protein
MILRASAPVVIIAAASQLCIDAMLYQIISLLLEVVVGIVGGACLLRLYMQLLRIPMSARSGNPLGRFVFALTDWIVLPLRRVLPSLGALDTASLVAAFVLQLAKFALLWLIAGAGGSLFSLPLLAVFGLLSMAISGLTVAVIVYAVLSWLPTSSVISGVMARLVEPLLTPIRRVLPSVGGIDLSPLVLLLLLQVAAIVLGGVRGGVLGA